MFALANAGEKIVLLDDLRESIGIGYITNSTSVNSTDEVEVQAVAAWSVVVNNFVLQTADIIGLPVCCYVIKTAFFCRSPGDRRPASNRQGHPWLIFWKLNRPPNGLPCPMGNSSRIKRQISERSKK